MKKIFLVKTIMMCIVCISNCMLTLTAAIVRESDPVLKQSEPGRKTGNNEVSFEEKESINARQDGLNPDPTIKNPAISSGKETPNDQLKPGGDKEAVINLNVDATSIQLDNITGSSSMSPVSTMSKETGSLSSEPGESAQSKEEPTLFDEKIDEEKFENNDELNQKENEPIDVSSVSITDQIQAPDKITADAMNEFLPEGEKMVLMGRREDGSNYMITAKTKAEATAKDSKIDTMKVLEFDELGVPIRDLSGQIKTTSLPMSEYQSKLSVPRENLLKQAQQDLANFKQTDNLQQKTDEYQKQEAAYNKAKATRNNLEEVAQSDPSAQAAYEKSKKDYQAAQQAFSMEDPQVTMQRLESKVNQYSDKKTRVATAEKKLQDAKQYSADVTQKRANLEAALKNESNVGKRAQISNDLQAAKNTEYFADQNVKDAVSKLQYTKNSTYSTDTADFQAVFDDVTAQFINDPAIMESLRNNNDYQDYRAQVTKEIYKPGVVKSTMNGIKDSITFMADVDLGKAFKNLTPLKDPGKYFRSLAKEAKYQYLGKPSQFQS